MSLGGQYRATREADGTWTIHDVPIFATYAPGEPERIEGVDRAWLTKAVEKAQEKHSKGKYLAPLHVNHHTGDKPTPRIGFVLPNRVGEMEIDGHDRDVLFADYVGVKDGDYEAFKRGDYPYCSIEAFKSGKRPEILSCAILTDEVPFFPFPIQTVGEESGGSNKPHPVSAVGVVGFSASGSRRVFFSRFPVADDDKPDDENDEEKDGQKPGLEEHEEGEDGSDGDGADDEGSDNEGEDANMADRIINAIAELGSKIDALAAAGGVGGGTNAKAGEPAEMDEAIAKHTKALSDDLATVKAENAKLAAEAETLRKEREREKALSAARREVVGFALDDSKLVEAYDKGGAVALGFVVETAKAVGIRAPDASWTRDEGRETSSLPSELAEFANQGTEMAAFALGCQREYAALQPSMKRGQTLKQYVEVRRKMAENAVRNGTAV